MDGIKEKSRHQLEDGTVDIKFVLDWHGLRADFVINRSNDGWGMADIYLISGSIDEAESVIWNFIESDYLAMPGSSLLINQKAN